VATESAPRDPGSARDAVAGLPPRAVTLENVTPAQLVLRYLAMEGATTLFGVPGAAVMQLLYELRVREDAFRYVVCRHETGAAYMADGYARAGGGLGVTVVTSGPGATNAVTGTMNAHASGTPVLTISGEVKEQYFGLGYLQEGIDCDLDIDAVYRASVGFTAVIDNKLNFPALFEEALRSSLSAPAGASHVSIPGDVASAQIDSVSVPSSPQNYRAVPDGCDPAAVDRALDFLLGAQRPLIFLGNGSRKALRGERATAFREFVERFAIPVMTTPEAKGIFPESHELALRNYGLAGCNWTTGYMVPPAGSPVYDCLLVVGSSLGELATTKTVPDSWDVTLMPAGPFIQLDVNDAVIGRAFPVDLGIVADAGPAIDQLAARGAHRPVPESAAGRRAFIAQVKQAPPAPPIPPAPTPGTVHPATLMAALDSALPAGSHVFVDAGNCVGWCNAYLEVDPPTQLHSALSMGPMGFAVCAVIGAKLAAPEAACVAVVGDGALLMHGSEISTAAQHDVGAVWVVLDDGDLTMVSQGMAEFFPALDWTDYYSLGATDIVGYATALGARAVEVTAADALPATLDAALSAASTTGQPQVVSVKVDPAAEPPYYAPPHVQP
jgi:acetolactate synthase-1/2/3 large subunit